jgi:aspartyl-tRNA(Asn)/glutamyl-tRNA(Gln) amidotransferase subunit A
MMGDSAEEETRSAIDAAVAELQRLGASVERITIPILREPVLAVHYAVVEGEAASYHRKQLLEQYLDFDYNTRVKLIVGAVLPTGVHTLAARVRAAIGTEILDAFDQFDVLIGAHRGAAPAIGDRTPVRSKEEAVAEQRKLATGYSTAFAMAGAPSASIPCGFSSTGLPLSFHLAARQMEETTILRVAHAYQSVTAWHQRHPSMDWPAP